MSRVGTAFSAFFKCLSNGAVAERVAQALRGEAPAPVIPPTPVPVPEPRPVAPKPTRSEALTLLATLQREGRLIDFLQESITDYNDAQIGAAVRDIHRDCAKTLERLFAIRPLVEAAEGSSIEVGGESDEYRLVGKVTGSAPFKGTVVHPGWSATKCDLPAWTGRDTAARVIAPAEVEMGPN